jgi:hypothetical protein
MSRNGDIVQSLGGEERTFRFGLAEHRRLQEKLGVGLSLIVQALHPYVTALQARDANGAPVFSLDQIILTKLLGDIRPEHIREVLFQGLWGGGMSPEEAAALPRLRRAAARYTAHGAHRLCGRHRSPAGSG